MTSAITKEIDVAVSTAKYGLLIFGLIFLGLSVYFVVRKAKLRSSIFKLRPTSVGIPH